MHCPRCHAPIPGGHRFCGYCGQVVVAAAPSAHDATERAELRHLTIVFSDLADSTALTARLGAESFRELLRDYRETGARIFAKYGGHVASYFGDGTLVYFGYPEAHEDSARRAVHAAVELLAAIRQKRASVDARWNAGLQLRTAVHTGTVVAGDLRSETTGEAMAVVGEAPNVAARLQQLAEPGTVLISDATHGLVRHDFACTCLGARHLKGITAPVVTYRVDATSPAARTRFDARLFRDQGRLIGRDGETRALAAAWSNALAGHSQPVLVRGDPGIGKSRLIAELTGEVERAGARQVVLQCSPIYQNTALHPFADYLAGLFGLDRGQTDAERIARIETAFLTRDHDPAEYVPLFASLLGVPLPGAGTAPPGLSPQQERAQVKQRIGDWLNHAAKRQPLLMVVEDLHWADPSTVELLSELLPRLAEAPVLIVLSSRDEFDAGLLGTAPRIDIGLGRLDHGDAIRMIEAVAGSRRALPSVTLDLIGSRTDGVPLFIEEMTRAVVEAGPDTSGCGAEDAALAVPATLAESLAARIGRVAASRELLEVIAALGRDFDLDLLSAVWKRDAATLRAELDTLVGARLLHESGSGAGRARYMFHHALIQEALYQSLLVSRRRSLHAAIADALSGGKFPHVAEDRPELLAHHHLRAGQDREALPFLRQAAAQAMRRSAYVEAGRHLRAVLEVIEAMPAGQERARLETELLVSLAFRANLQPSTFRIVRAARTSASDLAPPTQEPR